LVIGRGHKLAQLMAHAPSALVGHAQLALDLFGGHAMPSARHQVHGEEPLSEARPRLVKDGPSARIDMMTACLAGVGPPLVHGVKLPTFLANRAIGSRAPILDFHELGQASGIVRVFGLKLLEGVFGHD
jgi:hypothetical protein